MILLPEHPLRRANTQYKPPVPSVELIEHWLENEWNQIMDRPVANRVVRDKLDIDITSIWDIRAHWGVLTAEEAIKITRVLEKETSGVGASGNEGFIYYPGWGMKRKHEFSRWCSITALLGENWDSRGCLLNSMLSYTKGVSGLNIKNRILNPYTTRVETKNWLTAREKSIDKLFKRGLVARTFVIHENDCFVPSFGEDWVDVVRDDFKLTRKRLMALKRSGVIEDYMYSHESSCTSIESRLIHPHTHVIFWAGKNWSESAMRIALKLNKELTMGYRDDEKTLISWRSQSEDFKNYVGYINGVYDFGNRLSKEWTKEKSRELNIATRELASGVNYLFLKIHKTGCGGLKKNTGLQKSKGEFKIDQTKSCEEGIIYEQTSTLRGNNVGTGQEQHIQGSLTRNTRYTDVKGERGFISREESSTNTQSRGGEPRVQKGTKRGHAREGSGRGCSRRLSKAGRGGVREHHE
jgi:hypothetical protein